MSITAAINQTSADSPDNSNGLIEAKNLVDSIYGFRDSYFELHSVEYARRKATDVKIQLNKILPELNRLVSANKGDPRYLFYLGKALNVTDSHDPEAENYLAKAVKLDPTLTEAWNNLGKCFFKKGDIEGSKNCFTGALALKKNKESLRNLSIVMRQEKFAGPKQRNSINHFIKLKFNMFITSQYFFYF